MRRIGQAAEIAQAVVFCVLMLPDTSRDNLDCRWWVHSELIRDAFLNEWFMPGSGAYDFHSDERQNCVHFRR